MHVLITGGQGYIGSYLARAFLDAGHIVTTLDSTFNSKRIFDYKEYGSRLVRHQASVANPDAVGRAMDGVNVVYHLADRHDWENSPRHPLRLFETNVLGTATVLSMARNAGVDKVMFSSSTGVYGNLVGAKPVDPCMPISLQGASKLAAEAVCRGFYQLGLEVTILRIASTWGKAGSCSVVSKFASGHNVVYSDGSQTRDFVYIDDVVTALMLALDWDSNIYNIATGVETAVGGLFQIINPGVTVQYTNPPQDEVYRFCGDIDDTPWKPKVLISELTGERIKVLCSP